MVAADCMYVAQLRKHEDGCNKCSSLVCDVIGWHALMWWLESLPALYKWYMTVQKLSVDHASDGMVLFRQACSLVGSGGILWPVAASAFFAAYICGAGCLLGGMCTCCVVLHESAV
jgi:hypothetical protein